MNSSLGLARAACLLLLAANGSLLATAQPAQPPVFERRPLTDFQHMLDRPLFNLHRRPEETVSDDATSSVDEQRLRENWRLTGVVFEPGRQLALFVELKGKNQLQLETGTVLESNWTLDQIAADRVVLVRGAQHIEMLLFDPNTLPAAKPVKPAAPEQPAVRPKPAAKPGAAQPIIPSS